MDDAESDTPSKEAIFPIACDLNPVPSLSPVTPVTVQISQEISLTFKNLEFMLGYDDIPIHWFLATEAAKPTFFTFVLLGSFEWLTASSLKTLPGQEESCSCNRRQGQAESCLEHLQNIFAHSSDHS